jgi:hypothetical protein
MIARRCVWVAVLGDFVLARHSPADEVNLFLFAGQSNMAGADAVVSDPPGFVQSQADKVTRFCLASLLAGEVPADSLPWGDVRGHRSKDQLVHGPEVGFARTLHDAGWRQVVIIKVHANFKRDVDHWPWGKGGTFCEPWMRFVDARQMELHQQGYTVKVRGFVWHQGIDDALHGSLAGHYEQNLRGLIVALRERFRCPQAPVSKIVASITSWPTSLGLAHCG